MRFHFHLTDLFKTPDQLKLVKFLLGYTAAMSEREIASILKISHMTVNRTMQELADMNLVHCRVAGKAHLWEVNHDSFAFRMYERVLKNIALWADPLLELKQILLKNLPLRSLRRLVLYGSIARNDENPDSDIDVLILIKSAADRKKVEEAVESISDECLKVFGNRFAPYVLTEQQFNQKSAAALATGSELFGEINRGIQIYPEEKK